MLLTLLILIAGCSKESVGNFKNLFSVRSAIVKEFKVKDVNLALQNGNCIGVSFINSRFNGKPETVQEEVRQKTLKLIDGYYPPGHGIDKAWVSFVVHKEYFFVFHYTDSTNTIFYRRSSDGSWKKMMEGIRFKGGPQGKNI